MLRNVYTIIVGILIVAILVVFLIYLFADSLESVGAFRRSILQELVKAFLQLAVIGAVGGFVKYLFDKHAQQRAIQDAHNEVQRELLRKLFATYARIRKARNLIEAEKSAKTYGKQMSIVIDVRQDLLLIREEIETEKIFEKKPETIDNIQSMETYLIKLIKEYKDKFKSLSDAEKENKEVFRNLEEEGRPVLSDFLKIKEKGAFHKEYLVRYGKARNAIRRAIRASLGGIGGRSSSSK